MTARVTKQVVVTGYEADVEVRVTAMAIEVIRSVAGTSLGSSPSTKKTVIFVASS
jgi:hypothetical protein